MSASIRCAFADCQSDPDFRCTCLMILCFEHSSTHLRQEPDHSVASLFKVLIKSELDVLEQCHSQLDHRLSQVTQELLQQRESITRLNFTQTQSINSTISRNLEVAADSTVKLKTLLEYMIKRESYPHYPINDLVTKLLEARGTNLFTSEVMDELLDNCDLCSRSVEIDPTQHALNKVSVYLEESNLRWLSDSTLGEQTLPVQGIDSTSSCLMLSSASILITGGYEGFLSLVVNVATSTVKPFFPLNKRRASHAMAFVNGHPAVIGGTDGINYLTSVELFNGHSWQKGPKLVVGRWSHCAVTHEDKTFVFGGLRSEHKATDSIERLFEGQWQELAVTLPAPMHDIGAIVWPEIGIVLLGGQTKEGSVASILAWSEEQSEELNSLESPQVFRHSLWSAGAQALLGFNTEGNICKIQIQRQSSCRLF